MIIYLDTSAFIKLYVDEPGADMVRASVAANPIHTHWIAYAEMRATLARLHRMGYQTAGAYREHKREFEADWKAVNAILPDEQMLRRAGELAERFRLRGYDSVHLAAAESLRVGRATDFLRFASFDHLLNQSAEELGLRLLMAD
ncbi:MAG: type II toxin-antitoxin system VapC family toxin [Betaproteobacteria bacterium]|nr:type II toxin-antitoxin system VapC family toxin [Betaproteobacteria bacterium]